MEDVLGALVVHAFVLDVLTTVEKVELCGFDELVWRTLLETLEDEEDDLGA